MKENSLPRTLYPKNCFQLSYPHFASIALISEAPRPSLDFFLIDRPDVIKNSQIFSFPRAIKQRSIFFPTHWNCFFFAHGDSLYGIPQVPSWLCVFNGTKNERWRLWRVKRQTERFVRFFVCFKRHLFGRSRGCFFLWGVRRCWDWKGGNPHLNTAGSYWEDSKTRGLFESKTFKPAAEWFFLK